MSVMKTLVRQLLVAQPVRFNISRPGKYARELSTKRPVEDQNCGALKSNPYFDKYADKIKLLKETTPEMLQKRLITLLEKKKPEVQEASYLESNAKKLENLLPADSLHQKSASEVKALWHNFQEEKHIFTISLPSETYRKIEERGKVFPTFLFPLPRARGFEYIVSQFSDKEVHFSPLINYQKFKENAPECLAITHFTDLEDTTELVLVLGEFNTDVLDRTEALCLYHQLQRYYGEDDPRRLRIIEQFTNSPLNFHHMDLIAELESLRPV